MRKTKIICTLGPSTEDEKILRQLMLSGMDVARINMSHGTYEEHQAKIDRIKKLRKELDLPVAILLDTKGPEIRTGNFPEKAVLEAGQIFTLTTMPCEGNSERCFITFAGLPEDVNIGTKILIDDGLIEMEVTGKTETDIICRVINGGPVSSHKGINVPDITLSLPFLSERDKEDLRFGIEQDVDFVAASFTRSSDDINEMKSFIEQNGGNNIRIIAKIENKDGINRIGELIPHCDEIVIARGDLGNAMELWELPAAQKYISSVCREAGRDFMVVTQMLDSMIHRQVPTRAEVSDIFNAVLDGASSVMVTGETASGEYPVLAMRYLCRTVREAESFR